MYSLISQQSANYEGIYELEMSFRRMRLHSVLVAVQLNVAE
jgi:hypothetical protein